MRRKGFAATPPRLTRAALNHARLLRYNDQRVTSLIPMPSATYVWVLSFAATARFTRARSCEVSAGTRRTASQSVTCETA